MLNFGWLLANASVLNYYFAMALYWDHFNQ